MNKAKVLKLLNPILAALVLSQALMALLHDAVPEEVFEVTHGGGGILLVVGVVIHLILNWSWVRVNFLQKKDLPTG